MTAMEEASLFSRIAVLENKHDQSIKDDKALDTKITNLHRDIHSPEAFSFASRMLAIEQVLAKYRNLLYGGGFILVLLGGHNAIRMEGIIEMLKTAAAKP